MIRRLQALPGRRFHQRPIAVGAAHPGLAVALQGDGIALSGLVIALQRAVTAL